MSIETLKNNFNKDNYINKVNVDILKNNILKKEKKNKTSKQSHLRISYSFGWNNRVFCYLRIIINLFNFLKYSNHSL